MNNEIPISRIMLWDRQDKKMYPATEFHYNKEQGREYWKHKKCGCWVEDDVALDVFVIREHTASLERYVKGIHHPVNTSK